MEEVNQGLGFYDLIDYPDSYISEDLKYKDGYCHTCKSKAIEVKGQLYCARCYNNNRKTAGKAYSDEVKELVLTLMIDEFMK